MKRTVAIIFAMLLFCGCTGPAVGDLSQPTAPAISPLPTEQPSSAKPAEFHSTTNPPTDAPELPTDAPELSTDAPTEPTSLDLETSETVPDWTCIKPKICIDPGHYGGANVITGEQSYGYAEGDFTLRVALYLRDILMEKYGIEACLTRTTGTISLHGYTNAELDGAHLELRPGMAAEQDCDFFFSIHTNANLPGANGYPQTLQPIGITKTIVLANLICCEDTKWLAVANEVGMRVSAVNVAEGFAEDRPFQCGVSGQIPEWSDDWNDSLTLPGAVLCRHGSSGDYYGVLRGAADYGIPGVIVEHGFHTVAQMRSAAMNGDLAQRWAEADADGIAAGLGIQPINGKE